MSEGRKLIALSPTGARIVGTREIIPGTAACEFYENKDDPRKPHLEYDGQTDLDWDAGETQCNEQSEALYFDVSDQTWSHSELRFIYDFEAPVIATFGQAGKCQAYAVYEKDDNELPIVEGAFVFDPLHRSPQAHNIKLWPGYQSELSITENFMLAYHLGAISYSSETGQVVW